MRQIAWWVIFVVSLSGCGKAEPTLAGGKPVAYWVQALHDSDVRLRKKAAFKLGNVGPSDPAALPALRQALHDEEPLVRCEAIRALVKFAAAAQDVIPELRQLRTDADPRVRSHAEQALAKIKEKG